MLNKELAKKIGLSYNQKDYFVTPDRKLETYLYSQGIHSIGLMKGETNWTYWAYDRTEALQNALDGYRAYLSQRREVLDSYKKGNQPVAAT